MNMGGMDTHSVHRERAHLHRFDSSERTLTPIHIRLERDRSPSISPSTISSPATVVRWMTPPPKVHTPPLQYFSPGRQTIRSVADASEIHSVTTPTPATATLLAPATARLVEVARRGSSPDEATPASLPLLVRFDEDQIRSDEIAASKRDRMETVDMDSQPPTPGIDDTPYIRFAIDQLTRDQDVAASERPSASSSDSYPVERIIPDLSRGYVPPNAPTRESLALARKHRSSPDTEGLFNFNATRPLSPSARRPPETNSPKGEFFLAVDPPRGNARYPSLTYKPTILRLPSIITLSLLCIIMITALLFCALYPDYHTSLVGRYGGIYDGLYFVFAFLPQILAAVIFMYVQGVTLAMTRIMPYTMMAMKSVEARSNALFWGLYHTHWFWPRWEGPIVVDFSMSFFWLAIFTIPLQGCLFSVILVTGVWRWTAVQGVVWTLIAVYVLILVATVITGIFLFRRQTGLKWDPRSLADVIALLPRSNLLAEYSGTDTLRTKEELRVRLSTRSDRLGYWRTPNQHHEPFYCIGEEGTLTRRYTLGEGGKLQERPFEDNDSSDLEKAADLYSRATRFRYIPWFLRDTYLIFWCVAAFVLLLALFVVSFLPSTSIYNGFPPLVEAAPNPQGFSPANFLYSLVPSVLGMLLYLLFQPLDQAVRRLQPWSTLGHPEGAKARDSLLLTYAQDNTFSCLYKALSNGHYRVALICVLSRLFLLLPILAGGLFFPLTAPDGEVRMFANIPAFAIILTLLILYLFALFSLLPGRHSMHLPHPVSCLAEIISFVYNSGIIEDAAFSSPRRRLDLERALGATSVLGEQRRFAFGLFRGRNGSESLGIEKVGRRGADVLVLSG